MSKKLCIENINGECRNPSKGFNNVSIPGISDLSDTIQLDCPHCLRENGKDGNGNFICDIEKAKKIFEIFKDKVD